MHWKWIYMLCRALHWTIQTLLFQSQFVSKLSFNLLPNQNLLYHGFLECWNQFYVISDEPFISDISDDDDYEESDEPSLPNSSSQKSHSFTRVVQNIQFILEECMCFPSKDVTVSAIKQYHIDQGFKFVVIESKKNRYVVWCINYGNDCHWQLRASFSKVRQQWEIKKIEAPHTCLSTTLSQDHINFDSSKIAAIIVNLVK